MLKRPVHETVIYLSGEEYDLELLHDFCVNPDPYELLKLTKGKIGTYFQNSNIILNVVTDVGHFDKPYIIFGSNWKLFCNNINQYWYQYKPQNNRFTPNNNELTFEL